ncbi:MAG: hypothetical protein RL112_2358 [Planctomycetota bacterium]|jgi:hypothetical protein
MVRISRVLCTLALLASTARADLLVGRLVDPSGAPVPFGDLDFRFAGGSGGNPATVNDGANASGQFAVTIAAGTYDVSFNPPRGTSLLGVLRTSVAVAGTTNIGDVVLPLGRTISGVVVNGAGVGVAGVNFDAFDSNGVDQATLYDSSLAGGSFAFNVPAGAYELAINPAGVVGQVLAPTSLPIDATANSVNLGVVALQPGFTLSAIVRNASNLPMANVDIDVRHATTLQSLHTPGDDSNATGLVDVVVPAGTYFVDFKPTFATGMAPRRLGPTTVAATSTLGIVQLQAGLALTGVVRDAWGVAVPGANIDLVASATQVEALLVADGTDATGAYAVRAPAGTFDVEFKAPGGSNLGSQLVGGFVLAANSTLDGVLPPGVSYACVGDGASSAACPCGNNGPAGVVAGCANSLGAGAMLRATGAARISADTFVLQGSQMPNSSALYFQGTALAGAGLGTAFGDGLRCAAGSVIRLATRTNALSASSYPQGSDLPISVRGLVPVGATRVYQVWYRNAAAYCTASTFNLTNAAQVAWAP